MNNKEFDNIISGKLENISPEVSDNAWDSFIHYREAHQNFEHLEFDILFDDKIREQSKKMETAIPSDHWLELKKVLQLIDERKKELILGAFAQFIIVGLLIHLFLPEIEINHQKKLIRGEYAEKSFHADSKKDAVNTFPLSEFSNPPTITEYSDISYAQSVHSSGQFPDFQNFLKNTVLQLVPELISSDFDMDTNGIDVGEAVEESESSQFVILGSELQISVSPKKITLSEENSYASYKAENIDSYLVLNDQDNISSMVDIAFIPSVKENNDFVYSVSGFYSSDVNLINTPFDKVYSVASYSKEAFNRSAGVLFSMRKENLNLESGIRYTHLTYTPKIIKEEHNQVADIFFETSLDKIAFKIIHVPVHVKYHFLNTRKWSAYLLCGAGFNLITETDFDITTNIRQGRNTGLRAPDQDLRLIEEKRFNSGIFEGGGISENYFVTAALGFGVERQLAGPFSVFTQAVYNRHLFSDDIGIGPNKDKIHTMSLQGGIKIGL